MKKNLVRITVLISIIIAIGLMFLLGKYIGKNIEDKRREAEMKNILENGNLRNEEFYLYVIKDTNEKKEEI